MCTQLARWANRINLVTVVIAMGEIGTLSAAAAQEKRENDPAGYFN